MFFEGKKYTKTIVARIISKQNCLGVYLERTPGNLGKLQLTVMADEMSENHEKKVNASFSDLFAYQMKIFTFLQEILYENKLDIMKIKKVTCPC